MKNNVQATQKVEKAKIQLLLDCPFYATLILETDLIEDNNIFPPTACTNGRWIRYHTDFIDKLSLQQTKGVIAHELKHMAFLHHIRREGRDPIKWNYAADYIVNADLIEEGFQLPDGALVDQQYAGCSTEEVYSKIPDPPMYKITINIDGNGSGEEGEGSSEDSKKGTQWDKHMIGGVVDVPNDKAKGEEEARVKELVTRALQYAKQAGKLPGSLERQMGEMLKPRVHWERLVRNWIATKAKNDYSWRMKNLRVKNYYFPGLYSEELGTIVIAIDTSGSIDQNQYNRFISEVAGLRAQYQFECIFISCDASIQGEPKRYGKYQYLDYHDIKGGGGTSFVPPFTWVRENNIKPIGLIYFTDMYCNDFPDFVPNYDVLWLNYGGRGSKEYTNLPFGKVIDMEL
jgi:predicted metal-dependent peptidase